MELRQLESFLAVARHGHVTRAAQELFVTQPALSQQIRRLEQELGVALFVRTPTGVELTPAGADLAERAQAILAEVANARGAMDDHAGVQRGVARVAAAPADSHGLAGALATFHAAHPQVRLALRVGSAQEVLALLAQGAVDLAVTTQPAPAGTTASPLREEALVLVTPEGDAHTAGDPAGTPPARSRDGGTAGVAVASLSGRPLILAERGTALRDVVLDACQAAGFSPVPLLEASDPDTVLTLVRAGLGVGVVPASWTAGTDGVVTAGVVDGDGAPLVLRTLLLRGPAPLTPAAELLEAHLVGAA